MRETLIGTQAGPVGKCKATSTGDPIRITTGISKAKAQDLNKYLSRFRDFQNYGCKTP